MANSNNVAKKLKDEIDSGFELFREYKKVSDKFVSDMNKEINVKLSENIPNFYDALYLAFIVKSLSINLISVKTKKNTPI